MAPAHPVVGKRTVLKSISKDERNGRMHVGGGGLQSARTSTSLINSERRTQTGSETIFSGVEQTERRRSEGSGSRHPGVTQLSSAAARDPKTHGLRFGKVVGFKHHSCASETTTTVLGHLDRPGIDRRLRCRMSFLP